MAAVLYLYNNL